MATSLRTLRQEVGAELDECYLGVVASATLNNLTCTALIDSDESPSKYDRGWVMICDANAEWRRLRATDEGAGIYGYKPDSGVLSFVRPLNSIPSASAQFEIHTLLDPDSFNARINVALSRCTYVDEQRIAAVDGQRAYDLSAYTWLTKPEQVVNVFWLQGTEDDKWTYSTGYVVGDYVVPGTYNGYRYKCTVAGASDLLPPTWPTTIGLTVSDNEVIWKCDSLADAEKRLLALNWFRVVNDSGALSLHIRPYTSSGGEELVVQVVRPYDALPTETMETDCPLRWARAAAILEIYNWLMRTGPAEDVKRWKEARDEAAGAFASLCRVHAPRPARRIQFGDNLKRGVSSDVVA